MKQVILLGFLALGMMSFTSITETNCFEEADTNTSLVAVVTHGNISEAELDWLWDRYYANCNEREGVVMLDPVTVIAD